MNDLIRLIDESAEKFGRINLSSGNCGQFSLALAQKLIDMGHTPTIGILHEYSDDIDIDDFNIDDLAGMELPIYHIVVSVNDSIFDSTGQITTENLVDFSIREYKDPSPGYISDIDVNDIALMTLINFDTNWNIPAETFYSFLNNIQEKKPTKKLKNKI